MPRKPPAAGFKGRGAADNPAVRFEQLHREALPAEDAAGEPPAHKPQTVIVLQQARSIISRNESPDVPFSQSINPYQGCEHGCVYCYARPSHAYLDLSPGLDFETRLFGKANAAQLLRQELARPGYACDVIALGANTDPYQPVEREHRITRAILEVLAEHRHPVGIVTKSALVQRDIDVLSDLARDSLVHVFLSITSLDATLSRHMEPRAAAPHRRIEALGRLAEAGIPCGVLVAPVIPFVNDQEIEAVLEAAAGAGARMAGHVVLRLPHEVKGLFRDWLARHYPLRAAHVMSRVNDLRGGRDYAARFGQRMTGQGTFADLISKRFARACARYGLAAGERFRLNTAAFRVPGAGRQLELL